MIGKVFALVCRGEREAKAKARVEFGIGAAAAAAAPAAGYLRFMSNLTALESGGTT